MGLPAGRPSLARVLLLAVALACVPAAPPAAAAGEPAAPVPAPAGAVDNRRTPPPGSATLPVRGPMRAGAGAFAPGRVLVGFEAGAGEEGRRAAAVAVDGRVVAGNGRTRVVELDRDADVRAAARRLAGRPGVAYAEPDWVRRVDACDPDACWHLQPRPGANVVQAHQGGARGAGRTVAVVDTGVAAGVPDLAGRVGERWRCKQFTSPSGVRCEPAQAPPTSPHGTEVASVIAALDNDSGTTGVAPEATVVSYRVDNESGGIPISYLDKALRQIAADDDVDVVNLSLGGSQWSQTERDAIDAVLAEGKVVVASAGNTGDRIPQYPASFPGVVSVGATDDAGEIAGFSSFGKVDVVAPGDCVAVVELPGFDQDRGCPGDDGAGVAFNSGTSFAAPIASGVVALAASRTPLVARLALAASADEGNPAGAGDAKQWGHGLVDAGAFVAAHDDGAPPALVLETTGGAGDGHRIGSGDGQLPHPGTTYVAYAFQAVDGVAANPGTASFAGATDAPPPSRPSPATRPPSRPPWTAARWSRGSRRSSSAPPSTGRRRPARRRRWRWPTTTRRPGSTWPRSPTTAPGGGWTASTATTWTTSTPSPSARATSSTWPSPACRPTRWPCCCSTPAPRTCSASSARP